MKHTSTGRAFGLLAVATLALAPCAFGDDIAAPGERARYKLVTDWGPCDIDFHVSSDDPAQGRGEIYCPFDNLSGRFSWDVTETAVDLHEDEIPNFRDFFAAENCSSGWEDIEVGETSEALCWIDWTFPRTQHVERLR